MSDPQSHIKRWSDDYQKLYNDIYGKRIPNTLRKLTGRLSALSNTIKKSQPEELAEDGKPSIEYVARNRIDPMYADRETSFGERIAIKLLQKQPLVSAIKAFSLRVKRLQLLEYQQNKQCKPLRFAKRLNVAEDIRHQYQRRARRGR